MQEMESDGENWDALCTKKKKKTPDSSPPNGEKMDFVVDGGARQEAGDADEECLCLWMFFQFLCVLRMCLWDPSGVLLSIIVSF